MVAVEHAAKRIGHQLTDSILSGIQVDFGEANNIALVGLNESGNVRKVSTGRVKA